MKTGIGIIAEVEQVIWMTENPRYPAEERYVGEFQTTAGEIFPFTSDISVPTDDGYWKAIGRFDRERGAMIISDYNISKNDPI